MDALSINETWARYAVFGGLVSAPLTLLLYIRCRQTRINPGLSLLGLFPMVGLAAGAVLFFVTRHSPDGR